MIKKIFRYRFMDFIFWSFVLLCFFTVAVNADEEQGKGHPPISVFSQNAIRADNGALNAEYRRAFQRLAVVETKVRIYRYDVLQDPSEAFRARASAKAALLLSDTKASSQMHLLYCYALLRSSQPGLALKQAELAQKDGAGIMAKALEAWSLKLIATSVFRIHVSNGDPKEVRPQGVDGEGPLSESERRKYLDRTIHIVKQIVAKDQSKYPPDVYYIAAIVLSTEDEENNMQGEHERIAKLYRRYLEQCVPTHANYLRREFAERNSKIGNVVKSPYSIGDAAWLAYLGNKHSLSPKDLIASLIKVANDTLNLSAFDLRLNVLSGKAVILPRGEKQHLLSDDNLISIFKDNVVWDFSSIGDDGGIMVRYINHGNPLADLGKQNNAWKNLMGSVQRGQSPLSDDVNGHLGQDKTHDIGGEKKHVLRLLTVIEKERNIGRKQSIGGFFKHLDAAKKSVSFKYCVINRFDLSVAQGRLQGKFFLSCLDLVNLPSTKMDLYQIK